MLYPAELRNRPLRVISFKIGCKVSVFFANHKILDGKSYVSAVIEGVVAWRETLCGLEFADVQRIVALLLCQALLALGEGGTEEGITVAGQHNLPGAEVEGDGDDLALRDGETIDDGIGDILILHLLKHLGDDGLAGCVMGKDVLSGLSCGQQFADLPGSHFGKDLFVGFGILVELATDEALAVAHEPNLTAQAAVDDSRGSHAFLGVLLQARHDVGLTGAPEGDIVLADSGRHAETELMAGGVGGHLADVLGDGPHGIAPVAHAGVMPVAGLGCGAVDDSDEVTCDDDSVLAFPDGALRSEALLYDLHA